MNGKEMRLKRMLSRSKKLVIAAMDHGGFQGARAGLEVPAQTCAKLAKADAVLMMPGMVASLADQFTRFQSPLLITRVLWDSGYCTRWNYRDSRHGKMLTVAQAVSLGADAVLASLALHTGSEAADAENVGLFCEVAQEARELGIPLVGEIYPATVDDMSPDELHETILVSCRAIAEMGADMIKTFYTGAGFSEIVKSTPVPLLALGAEKTPTERDALQLAANAVNAGAGGIVFGRNIFQSSNPPAFIDAVREVINSGADIDQTVRKYALA